jgi:hypothetical protein
MSAYPPPNENLPIFDSNNFHRNTEDPETIARLSQYFLQYPQSQGSETINGSLIVTGTLTTNDLTLTNATVTNTLTSGDNILFSGPNTTLTSGINYKTETVSAGNFNVTNAHLLSQLRFVSGADFNVNLQSTINSLNVGKPMWFCNTSAYKMTVITTVPQGLFRGRYGNELTAYLVESGGTIGLYNGGTNWIVFFKDSQSIAISTSTNFTNQLQYLLNSVVRLTPTSAITLTLPQLTTSLTEVFNGIITFNNTANQNVTLSIASGNFVGIYGTYTNSYIIYPYTTITLQPQPISNTYNILSRDLPTITRTINHLGTTVTLTYNDLDSIINLTGTASNTTNLPDPRASVNPYIRGRQLRIYNNGSATITLSTTNSNFTGAYGNDSTSISLPDNTWYSCTSNGSNWDINERSSNITYQLTGLNTPVDYTSNFNLTNATINVSLTSAGVINWIVPSASRSRQQTTIVNNIGAYDITLTILSGTFAGEYGSGLNTLLISAGRWVQVYSDSTNWRVDSRSPNTIVATNDTGPYYPVFTSASGSGQTLRADTTAPLISINPSTGNLTASNFTGNLDGTATITNTTDTGPYHPLFASGSGSGQILRNNTTTAGRLTYNPSTNVFSNFQANGFTTQISIGATPSGTFYPTFSTANGTGVVATALSTKSNYTYNTSTNTLTAPTFSGALTGNVTGDITGGNVNISVSTGKKLTFGSTNPYVFNSVYQTITNSDINWDSSIPATLPQYILFSNSGTGAVYLTLPRIENANIFEGMSITFRRTNTFNNSTTTSTLAVYAGPTSVTDVIYVPGFQVPILNTVAYNVLGSGVYFSTIVCVNKTTTPYAWAVVNTG